MIRPSIGRLGRADLEIREDKSQRSDGIYPLSPFGTEIRTDESLTTTLVIYVWGKRVFRDTKLSDNPWHTKYIFRLKTEMNSKQKNIFIITNVSYLYFSFDNRVVWKSHVPELSCHLKILLELLTIMVSFNGLWFRFLKLSHYFELRSSL